MVYRLEIDWEGCGSLCQTWTKNLKYYIWSLHSVTSIYPLDIKVDMKTGKTGWKKNGSVDIKHSETAFCNWVNNLTQTNIQTQIGLCKFNANQNLYYCTKKKD